MSAFLSFLFSGFFIHASGFLSPSLARLHSGAYATPEGNPGWPASFARLFVKGDKPNRAAYSREKTTMKTDKNSRTTITSGTDTHPEQAFPSRQHTQAVSPKRARISYEKWLEKYRPVKNSFAADAPYDGYMFEIYGTDFEFVRRQPAEKIWTLIDDGDRNQAIYSGCHYVDRIGYFVTEVPYPSNRIFCIRAD